MTVPTNRWTVGTMYYQGLLNGSPFYSQPGGPGTQVFPTERNGAPWPEYPIPGLVINEYQPWVVPGCLHSVKEFCVIQEYDYATDQQVALLTCPTCSYVQRAVYGGSLYGPTGVYDPNLYAVIVA